MQPAFCQRSTLLRFAPIGRVGAKCILPSRQAQPVRYARVPGYWVQELFEIRPALALPARINLNKRVAQGCSSGSPS